MTTRTERKTLDQYIAEQRAWIEKCGGTRQGYRARYGDPDMEFCSGDGGTAIWNADNGELNRLLVWKRLTATLNLHPINFWRGNEPNPEYASWRGYAHQRQTWEFSPDHLPHLLRLEYRFLRQHGTPRNIAAWHIHRMVSMIHGPFGWTASIVEPETESETEEFDDSEYPPDPEFDTWDEYDIDRMDREPLD